MILLTRLNGTDLWLSPMLMESIEQTPDTVITMTNGHKYVVRQPASEIAAQTVLFYKGIGLVGSITRKDEVM